MTKKCISFILSFLCVILCFPISANAQNTDDLNEIYETINSALAWASDESGNVINDSFVSGAGTSNNDWFAFTVGRIGIDEAFNEYTTALENVIESSDQFSVTDYQRMSLAMLSCGGNPKDCGLFDKAVNVLNDDNLSEQKVNTLIFALLTLDSVQYKLSETDNLSRTGLISQIFCNRLENGAFSLNEDIPDTDITAMVIYALSPYYNSEQIFKYTSGGEERSATVREVIERALEYLSSVQKDDGDMPSWGTANCESTAQTIIALCSVGIDLRSDERFIKNGKTLLDGIMKYQTSDGGFAHTLTDSQQISNGIATAQAVYGLTAYCRFKNGYNRLFDMSEEFSNDTKSSIAALNNEIVELQNVETDTEKLVGLLSRYEKFPLWERTYVNNFYILSDALDNNDIENSEDFSADDIGVNNSANGTVVDITVDSEKSIQTADPSDEKIGTSDTAVKPLESDNSAQYSSHGTAVVETVVLLIILAAAVITLIVRKLRARKLKDI